MAFNNIKKETLALLLVFIYHTAVKGIEKRDIAVDFYGHNISINYDNKLNEIRYESAVEQFITRFDEESISKDYVSLIHQFRTTTAQYGLDDVGKVLLVNAFAEKAFAHKPQNFRTLIKWYILYHDSMDVMLCYNKKDITIYGRLNIQPYGIAYIHKGGIQYTDLSFALASNVTGSVAEYRPKNANIRTKIFNFNTTAYPKLNALKKQKDFAFDYAGKQYRFSATINQSLILYLKDLPVMELGNMYVNCGFSQSMQQSLIANLRTTIAPMKQREALGFLLKFVQSIPYKTDDENWGYERYSFAEETLYNDFADCEDKVILYATLAKELLNVQSAALLYEKDEHVAIALKLPANAANFSFTYKGDKYLTAEPSGQGFELGRLGFDVKRVDKVVALY